MVNKLTCQKSNSGQWTLDSKKSKQDNVEISEEGFPGTEENPEKGKVGQKPGWTQMYSVHNVPLYGKTKMHWNAKPRKI